MAEGESLMEKVMSVGMAIVLIGALIPIGLQMIATANMTGVDETVAQVFTVVLPILVIIALVRHFVRG